MRYLVIIICFFINFKFLHGNENLGIPNVSSEILPNNSIYKKVSIVEPITEEPSGAINQRLFRNLSNI